MVRGSTEFPQGAPAVLWKGGRSGILVQERKKKRNKKKRKGRKEGKLEVKDQAVERWHGVALRRPVSLDVSRSPNSWAHYTGPAGAG